MPYDVRIDLTNEAPWANSWCGYRATVTNSGYEATGRFELMHQLVGPSGEVSRGGLGVVENLDPGHYHTTDEFNVMPVESGQHTLTVSVWQDGNEQASFSHTFTVQ